MNRVDGVEFDIAEPLKYRDEARLKAIRAAREKAIAMASELGQKIGNPWEITEEQGTFVEGFQSNSRARNYSVQAYSGNDPTIAPGRVGVNATVRVSFLLE